MDAGIQIFENPQFGNVRVTMSESNDPLFCLADVAKALDIKNVSDLKSRLNQKGVAITDTPTKGGIQPMVYINEGNVYRCIFQSRKPDAEKFQDWVCYEVLPSIRKTGGYMVVKEEDTPESIMARALLIAQDTLDRKQAVINQLHECNQLQAKELKQAAPKVEYYDTALSGQGTYSTTDIAKDLGMSAKTLNKKLHSLGIQYKQHDTWYLYAEYQDKGYARIVPNYIADKNGETVNHPSMRWTEAGRKFILELHEKGKI